MVELHKSHALFYMEWKILKNNCITSLYELHGGFQKNQYAPKLNDGIYHIGQNNLCDNFHRDHSN